MRWRKRREGKGGGKGRVEIWKERRKEREEERMGDPGRCDTEGGVCKAAGTPIRVPRTDMDMGKQPGVGSVCVLPAYV